jgi:DNA repair protein RecO (recombination protein O)
LGGMSEDSHPDRVLRWFELQLLNYMGYAPELSQCVQCRNELQPTINGFSPAQGGAICASCRRLGVGRDLSVNALKILRLMQRNPYRAVSRVRLDPELSSELSGVMQSYITYTLERELRSAHFVKNAGLTQ